MSLDNSGSSLEISSVDTTRRYACLVSDPFGNQEWVRFYITVDNQISIRANGENTNSSTIKVAPGERAVLTAEANGKYSSDFSYVWYKVEGWSETLISGCNDYIYTTDPVETAQNYRCDVRDIYGNTNSGYFYVKVDSGFSARAETSSFVIEPGENVTLNVIATANDPNSLTFRWSGSVWNGEGAWESVSLDNTGSSLELQSVETNRNYSCNVSDQYGNEETIGFYVSIDNDFSISNGSAGSLYYASRTIFVQCGGTAILEPEVKGEDLNGVIYQWTNTTNGHWESLDFTGSPLMISDVQKSQSYSVTATDRFGNTSSGVDYDVVVENHLVVSANDTSYSTQAYMVVKPGQDITLKATVNADDMAGMNYRWINSETGQTM